MAAKEVVHYGNSILRKKCELIKNFDNLDNLIENMFDTMYEENGIGLAANQIDVDLQLFIVDISDIEEEGESIHVFANAEIIDSHGESWLNEGCLSVPDIRLDIKRSNKITLKYQDRNGKAFSKEFDGLLARVIQHEIDHLNGMTIMDRQMITTVVSKDKFGRNEKVMITDGKETKELKWKKAKPLVDSGDWEIYVGGPIT